jgi:poly(3-hydroxybutyrate) depolymerase
MNTCRLVLALSAAEPDTLGPGDHTRTLMMGEQKRTYLVHVPKDYEPKKPTPFVLALNGVATNGAMMGGYSGLNRGEPQKRRGMLAPWIAGVRGSRKC